MKQTYVLYPCQPQSQDSVIILNILVLKCHVWGTNWIKCSCTIPTWIVERIIWHKFQNISFKQKIIFIHRVVTGQKNGEFSLKNPLDVLQKRQWLRISGFWFQVYFISEKDYQCLTVNILQMCNEWTDNVMNHFQQLLCSGWAL